ncbi:hypothetical protein D5F11_019610 [Siminovitchia terrae]|uniref:Uncharacterized protein n=1 Tax=Siminovitchia terrae TaxID=1914933 RepID=A0A429X3P0_SIMTE|nr:hypothetical protein [Siminovitchia terrae]RST57996.1 hypothetical protein D5F11_019610 [Siminovitchia terrae]
MVFNSAGGGKPRPNKVKASGGCHRFSEEIYRAPLDKIWAQIRQGAFDYINVFLDIITVFTYKKFKHDKI